MDKKIQKDTKNLKRTFQKSGKKRKFPALSSVPSLWPKSLEPPAAVRLCRVENRETGKRTEKRFEKKKTKKVRKYSLSIHKGYSKVLCWNTSAASATWHLQERSLLERIKATLRSVRLPCWIFLDVLLSQFTWWTSWPCHSSSNRCPWFCKCCYLLPFATCTLRKFHPRSCDSWKVRVMSEPVLVPGRHANVYDSDWETTTILLISPHTTVIQRADRC